MNVLRLITYAKCKPCHEIDALYMRQGMQTNIVPTLTSPNLGKVRGGTMMLYTCDKSCRPTLSLPSPSRGNWSLPLKKGTEGLTKPKVKPCHEQEGDDDGEVGDETAHGRGEVVGRLEGLEGGGDQVGGAKEEDGSHEDVGAGVGDVRAAVGELQAEGGVGDGRGGVAL